jgi:uncharacterized protein YjbI with pentapeptide repeats
MANPEHLKILSKGISAWNKWRAEADQGLGGDSIPDLSYAILSGKEFKGINFCDTNLHGANLEYANFYHASFVRADLTDANLVHAVLCNADLTRVILDYANLQNCDLRNAILHNAHFYNTKLSNAKFNRAQIGYTTFAATNLAKAKGLSSVKQITPSTIGIDTLYNSKGEIPDTFLRDAGVPEEVIEHLLPSIRIGSPIQWYSCFISFSTKNHEFAERLHSRMRHAELRVWFAPEDMKGGAYFSEQIERAIQLHDRLLLVLSGDSIKSKWVEREIRKARKVERTERRRKLFPIRLVDMETLRAWECLDSDTGEDLAEEVRKYHIPDFSNWKNHDAFEAAFAKLEKDLRTATL